MVSTSGPSCSDLPVPSSNKMEPSSKKRVKKNNLDTEDDSDDGSCFVALVTDLNLQRDALYLPKDFSDSNGLRRESSKILVIDGDEKSWELDLTFNESSGEFYISSGWRSFCDAYRKKVGSHYVFKLVGKGETPVLSFCPTESRGETASKKESPPKEPGSGQKISEDLAQPSENRIVTLKLSQSSLDKSRQYLSLRFMRENDMNKSGMINMLGKDGKISVVGLRLEDRQMRLTKNWSSFAIENGLKAGDSFKLEAVWDNGTPMLRLFSADSASRTRELGESSSTAGEKEHASTKANSGNKTMEAKNNREEMRESLSASQNRIVTLKLTAEDVESSQFILPSEFRKANGINHIGKLTFLAKSKVEYYGWLISNERGTVAVGCDWKGFCEDHGVEIGDYFTLEFIKAQDSSPVIEFSPKL